MMSLIPWLQFVLFSVCVHLFTLFSYCVYYSDRLYFDETTIEKEYDYIIVGSGTAGSVVARRLATETGASFSVLEAGARGAAALDVPVLGPFLHRSLFDWQFHTSPQPHACRAMDQKKCRLPQGKILGGSSKLNNMIYVRGNISQYAQWFGGAHSPEDIRRHFRYVEEHLLHLNSVQYHSELADAVLDAAKELGYNEIDMESQIGFRKSLLSQRAGKRWSASDNLLSSHIISNAMVENIIIQGNTAVGVNVAIMNKNYQIYCRKGVILTAGAINTPKLLQLSGIGPLNVLGPLGIPIIKELPVGENLQDHVATGLDLVLFNKSVSVGSMDMVNPLNALKYFMKGEGPLTTPGCEVIGFVSTKNDSTADLEYMILPVGLSEDRGSLFAKNLGIQNEIFDKYFAQSFDKHAATFLPVVLHPKSKGKVFITSRDPYEPPTVDPQYLKHKEDVEVLINGLRILRQLLETRAMKELGAEMNRNPFPGCEGHELFSPEYLECYVRHLTLSSYHPVGTCALGAVVDAGFKVIGAEQLFVADAAALPAAPGGNVNAAVGMMASIFFETVILKTEVVHNSYCHNTKLMDSLLQVCSVNR